MIVWGKLSVGRWAQARRRGSGTAPAVVLGPPPVPLLTEIDDQVVQTATGLDDTGGTCQLQFRELPEGAWEDQDSTAWSSAVVWFDVEGAAAGDYRCREIGNGSTYSGASEWSAVFSILV